MTVVTILMRMDVVSCFKYLLQKFKVGVKRNIYFVNPWHEIKLGGTCFILAAHTCSTNEFICNNTRCIPKGWKCDGDQDCADNSDETSCEGHEVAIAHPCSAKEFTCDNHDCIHASWKCDGDKDCIDGSDENNCNVSNLLSVMY